MRLRTGVLASLLVGLVVLAACDGGDSSGDNTAWRRWRREHRTALVDLLAAGRHADRIVVEEPLRFYDGCLGLSTALQPFTDDPTLLGPPRNRGIIRQAVDGYSLVDEACSDAGVFAHELADEQGPRLHRLLDTTNQLLCQFAGENICSAAPAPS